MSTSPSVTVNLTEEQKILATIQTVGKAASDVASIWGHDKIASLVAEVPSLAPVMVGFLDAVIAATTKKS